MPVFNILIIKGSFSRTIKYYAPKFLSLLKRYAHGSRVNEQAYKYLFLIVKVCDEAVRVIMLRMVERKEKRKVIPVVVLLVAHMISNSTIKHDYDHVKSKII